MALFTESRLRARIENELRKGYDYFNSGNVLNKAQAILNESQEFQSSAPSTKIFDIFLSHSSKDAQIVAGSKLEIEDLGYSVYVDWIEDPVNDKSTINRHNALMC